MTYPLVAQFKQQMDAILDGDCTVRATCQKDANKEVQKFLDDLKADYGITRAQVLMFTELLNEALYNSK